MQAEEIVAYVEYAEPKGADYGMVILILGVLTITFFGAFVVLDIESKEWRKSPITKVLFAVRGVCKWLYTGLACIFGLSVVVLCVYGIYYYAF